MLILLVDDDRAMRDRVADLLKQRDQQVVAASNCDDAIQYLRGFDIDVVLLDPDLRAGAGWRRMPEIRRARQEAGLVLLGADLSARPRLIEGLRHADDCLSKPGHPEELLARLQAVLRRCRRLTGGERRYGNVLIDVERRLVRVGDNHVHLTNSEWRVLEALVVRPDRPMSKETLYERLYPNPDGEAQIKIIDVFICKLRRKLKAAGAPDGLIATVWGHGVRLDPKACDQVAA